MDDHSSLPARWRFLGHAAAAAWVLCWMGRVPRMPVFGTMADLPYAGPVLCGLYLVWMINLFNFMGGIDGNGFLGLMVALLSLWCGQATPALFWAWFILIGCFMVDATTTLVRRVRRGERFHEAHRSHAYQYASRRAAPRRPPSAGNARLWRHQRAVAACCRWPPPWRWGGSTACWAW